MKPLYLTDEQARLILRAADALVKISSVEEHQFDIINLLIHQALFDNRKYGELPRGILTTIDRELVELDAFTQRNAEIKGVL
jgi:hypothetical protein